MGREHAPNGRDQRLEFDRFGTELLAPCGDGLLALALHRMRGHADDWNVPLARDIRGPVRRAPLSAQKAVAAPVETGGLRKDCFVAVHESAAGRFCCRSLRL